MITMITSYQVWGVKPYQVGQLTGQSLNVLRNHQDVVVRPVESHRTGDLVIPVQGGAAGVPPGHVQALAAPVIPSPQASSHCRDGSLNVPGLLHKRGEDPWKTHLRPQNDRGGGVQRSGLVHKRGRRFFFRGRFLSFFGNFLWLFRIFLESGLVHYTNEMTPSLTVQSLDRELEPPTGRTVIWCDPVSVINWGL